MQAECQGEAELLHQVQKDLATAHEKVKASSASAVAMKKERDAKTTKYEKLRLSLEEGVGFSNMIKARLKTEAVKVTQERDAVRRRQISCSLNLSMFPG